MLNSRLFQAYLIPGAVFQSVAIAGGYGTGREIMQFFTSYGALGGLYGFSVATLGLALVLGLSYEFARCFRVYDYRSFFRRLIGPFWIAFEALYLLMLLLVLAVIGSAAGSIVADRLGIPHGVGLGVMLAAIVLMTFYGRALIARVMTFWSAALYTVFIVYFAAVVSQQWPDIVAAFDRGEARPGWVWPGLRYAMYSSVIVPAILFATRGITTRQEAFLSGLISAVICQIPGFIFHISFVANAATLADEPLPAYATIVALGLPWLLGAYTLVLFGTFIETGVGFVHGVNERLDRWFTERSARALPRWVHSAVAVAGLLGSAALAQLGIIRLIGQGYASMAWGFLVVYLLPLMTIGVYRLRSEPPRSEAGGGV